MKKIHYLVFVLTIILASCETETISVADDASSTIEESITENAINQQEDEVEIEELESVQSQFLNEVTELGLDKTQNISLQEVDLQNQEQAFGEASRGYNVYLTSLCLVKDADRCPFEDRQPKSNMWWPENDTDFFNPTAYFSSSKYSKMIFATFSNGTALIRGITKMNEGQCKVYVNVWLKNKRAYDEFSANGGEFRLEPGCASQVAIEEELVYYEIDNSKSWLYAQGEDCISEGFYGVEQRSESFRGQLGPNGAAFDSNIGALGFSNWGWITDKYTGERLWVMDFDFRLRCYSLY